MPTNNGVRLHDRQRIANFREQPIETNEYQAVDGAEGEFFWSSSPQNVYLLPQSPNLCLECCPRPDQIDNRPTNKPEKIPHYTTSSPDSPLPASRMRFTTGTPNTIRPAHIHFEVYGQQDRLVTQMYFEGAPYNNTDSFLQSAGRPELLITKLLPPPPELESESKLVVFDIVLYGG